jgi:hypothetical protein
MRADLSDIPHRKNAAEWVMWVALQPVRWFLLLRTMADRRTSRSGAPDGR